MAWLTQQNSVVNKILEYGIRLNSKTIQQKDVVSSEQLIELCCMYTDTTDVLVLRDLAMGMLSYAGFLRYNEVRDLRCCDVRFNSDHCVISVKKSKTDIYRGGREVLIAKDDTCACPEKLVEKYMFRLIRCSRSISV